MLIVEDVVTDVELIVLNLEKEAITFTYDVANTEAACLQQLQVQIYDAVLSNYRLPGLEGLQTLKLLQQSGQDIPFILVTSNLGESVAVDCFKAGITDYVLKEQLSYLPTALDRALRQFEQRRQQQATLSQLQQQIQHERLLNQLSQALNFNLDAGDILREVVQCTGECFRVDRVVVFAMEADQVRVLEEWRVSDQLASLPDFEASMLLDSNGSRTLLSVPILIRGQLFGGLVLHTVTAPRTFNEDEIRLLERIADQTTLALSNAHHYHSLEQQIWQRSQELEQEKQRSEVADQTKRDFLTNMSHELRTPLTGILGFSSVLLKEAFGPLNDKQKQYVSSILSCGQHLLELINDLLDLSKVEAGRENLALETVQVEEVCQACLFPIQEQAQSRGLQISLSLDPTVETCIADRRRLRQILENLLSNAVKFTEAGSVTLSVGKTENTVTFSVTDSGIGISAADQATLFQPFRQLDSGLSRKYEGAGLGLALSRKLAQLHGGEISLSSELGRGSCFTLHLPYQPLA